MQPTTHDAVRVQLLFDVLRLSGTARVRVFGSSMLPAILPGDSLIIRRDTEASISLGDIVVYAKSNRLFAHRVIGKTVKEGRACLLTLGDSLSHTDPPVFAHELLGQVTSIIRGPRRFDPRTTLVCRLSSIVLRNSALLTRCFLWLLVRTRHSSAVSEC